MDLTAHPPLCFLAGTAGVVMFICYVRFELRFEANEPRVCRRDCRSSSGSMEISLSTDSSFSHEKGRGKDAHARRLNGTRIVHHVFRYGAKSILYSLRRSRRRVPLILGAKTHEKGR